jgi:hypothetical protein
MDRLANSIAGLVAFSALLGACSSGSSEPVTPEASADAVSSATVKASATASSSVAPPSATATATAAAAAIAPTQPGADLKVVPMKMSFNKSSSIELKADGTLWGTKDGKTLQIGNVTKNTLNITEGNTKGTISVWSDDSVTSSDVSKKARFDDKDALVMSDGSKLSVDDSGKLVPFKADGTPDKNAPAVTITGFKPEARRTAVFFGVLFFMASPQPPTPPVSSAPSAPPPAPKH